MLQLTTALGTSQLTYQAGTSSIEFPNGEIWSASGFVPSGRFQYETTRIYFGTTPVHPEPWFRWNAFGSVLVGDVTNGVVAADQNTGGSITWENGALTWDAVINFFPPTLDYYTGTLDENKLHFSDGTWNLSSLKASVTSQQLVAETSLLAGISKYKWYQDGILQNQKYVPRGSRLLEDVLEPTIEDNLVATYSADNGTLTFEDGTVWTKLGSVPRLPAQELRFQGGHSNAVLYLMMEGGCTGLNSRGPGHHTSTVAKLSLDPHLSSFARRYAEGSPLLGNSARKSLAHHFFHSNGGWYRGGPEG